MENNLAEQGELVAIGGFLRARKRMMTLERVKRDGKGVNRHTLVRTHPQCEKPGLNPTTPSKST